MTIGSAGDPAAVALIDESALRSITYAELADHVGRARRLLASVPRPALAFQFAGNSVGAVVAYLACLAERIPLGLGEPAVAPRARVVQTYAPTVLFLAAGDTVPPEYRYAGEIAVGSERLWLRTKGAYEVKPAPELALLLATSGSTGDPKFVRLSRENLESNASAIAQYLGIKPGENAIQSLPMHYSYGLSVLNSHLATGATVTLTKHSFMRPEFWKTLDECGCTSFAGVPYMYETLLRLRMNPGDRPSLRTMTQAGGHLRPESVKHFHAAARAKGKRFFVMYGQTEATARISYVPPERLPEKAGTIGIAIPGGELSLAPVEDDSGLRQLSYRGPNVMLGYATAPADLAKGDELGGVLATGDLAETDEDGFFRITGRLARFAKLFGKRINLAGVEAEVEGRFATRAAALDGAEALRVIVEVASAADLGRIRAHLAEWLGVPPVAIKSEGVDRLPLTASGKKDYKALA